MYYNYTYLTYWGIKYVWFTRSYKKRLLELEKNKPLTEEMKEQIRKNLIQAGILDKTGKLKELNIK